MGYDRGDSFPFNFERKIERKTDRNCRHDHIPFNLKGNKKNSFLSVEHTTVLMTGALDIIGQVSVQLSEELQRYLTII